MKYSDYDSRRCKCDTAWSDIIQNKGRASCPECYTTFSEEYQILLVALHGAARHKGHVPARVAEKIQKDPEALVQELQELEDQMQSAIKAENYERAAKIRDEIKCLKLQ
jgi:protein arginine kinase activator